MEVSRYIELEISGGDSSATKKIRWKLVDEVHALFWFKKLHQLIKNQVPLFLRLTGLNRSSKNLATLTAQLNTIIELINGNTTYSINERADGSFSQSFANSIHHHFEILYGDAHSPSKLYQDASPLVRSAITKINHIIHDMEALTRNIENSDANKAIVAEFLNRPQFKMADDFLEHFKLDIDFGDMVLHYGIIGKTWWEVFLDGDKEILNEAIRPLNFMSGEFDIHFSKAHPSENTLRDFYKFLEKQGLDKEDPSLCLGYLQLAKLDIEKQSKEEILELLNKEISIAAIRLYEDGQLIQELNLVGDKMAEEGFFLISEAVNITNASLIKLERAAVQLIPLITDQAETILEGSVFDRGWNNLDHCVCLMGTSDTNRILIRPSSGEIDLAREVSLGKGDIIELAYDKEEGRYVVISSKN